MCSFFFLPNSDLLIFMSYFEGRGIEVVEQWLKKNIVGCREQFFIDCQTRDFLKDPEVLLAEKSVTWC